MANILGEAISASNNYAYNTPEAERLAQRIYGVFGGSFNNLPPEQQATLKEIIASLASATSHLHGVDPLKSGRDKFSNIYSGVAAAGMRGGIHAQTSTGRSLGYSYGAGSFTANATKSILGYIDNRSASTGESEVAAAVLGDAMKRNGVSPDMLRVADFGNGSTDSILKAVTQADGRMDATQMKELRKSAGAAALLQQLAAKKLGKTYQSGVNYMQDEGLTDQQRAEIWNELQQQADKNGGHVLTKDQNGNINGKYSMKDLQAGELLTHKNMNAQYADRGVMEDMWEKSKDSIKVMSEIQREAGLTVEEMSNFAKQTNMGAISNKKTADNMRSWMKSSKEIAYAAGKELKEVMAIQSGIADALTGTGAVATQDKVLKLTKDRLAIAEEGDGFRSTDEKIAASARSTERSDHENRGLYIGRMLLDDKKNGFSMKEEDRNKVTEYMDKIQDPNTSLSERTRLTGQIAMIGNKYGVDMNNEQTLQYATKEYSQTGDLDATEDQAYVANIRSNAARKAVEQSGGKLTRDEATSKIKAVLDAVGGDMANSSGDKQVIMELAEQLRTGPDGNPWHSVEELQKDGKYSTLPKEFFTAAQELADLDEDQLRGVMAGVMDQQTNSETGMARISSRTKLNMERRAAEKMWSDMNEDYESMKTDDGKLDALGSVASAFLGGNSSSDRDVARAAQAAAAEYIGKQPEKNRRGVSAAAALNRQYGLNGKNALGAEDIREINDALDENGKLTNTAKSDILNLMGDQSKAEAIREAGLDSLSDGEYLKLLEDGLGGSIQMADYTGSNGQRYKKLVHTTSSGMDKLRQHYKAVGDKHKDAVDAFGGAEKAADYLSLGVDGDVTGLRVAKFDKTSNGKLDKSALQVGSTIGTADLIKAAQNESTLNDLLGLRFSDTNKEGMAWKVSDVLDSNGKIKESFWKDYGESVSGMERIEAEQAKLPDWLKSNIDSMQEDLKKLTAAATSDTGIKIKK